MFSQHNKSRSYDRSLSAWEQFIAACTRRLGAFYRPDGTLFRDPEISSEGSDLDFADLTQRTHLRLRHQETQRQLNLEAITHQAYQQIQNSQSDRDIDEDWLSLFFSYAQDVSSKTMQELWAKALAIEISQPGSMSKHSLRFLRNLDAWELKAFRKVAASAFIAANGHPFIFKAKSHVSAADPIFTEHRLLAHCIASGMVDKAAAPLTAGFKFNYDGACQVVQQNPFSPGDNVGYYIQRFTRIGSDLYRLLTYPDTQYSQAKQKRLVWDFLTDYLELGIE